MYDVNIIDEYFFAFELGKVKIDMICSEIMMSIEIMLMIYNPVETVTDSIIIPLPEMESVPASGPSIVIEILLFSCEDRQNFYWISRVSPR